jgi:hypothetical protein
MGYLMCAVVIVRERVIRPKKIPVVPVTRPTLDFLATQPIFVYIILLPLLTDALKFCRNE